jgi:shikimate kinase
MFGLQTQLIVLGVAAVVAFGGGWKTRDAFCDTAKAKQEAANLQAGIKLLNERLETSRVIAEQDANRAKADAERIAELRRKINETPANNEACLDPDAAGRVDGVR